MKQQNNTLNLDNKNKIKRRTGHIETNQESSTTNFQRRLTVISKKLNLCYLINVK